MQRWSIESLNSSLSLPTVHGRGSSIGGTEAGWEEEITKEIGKERRWRSRGWALLQSETLLNAE